MVGFTDGGLTVGFTSSPNPNAFIVSNDIGFVTLHASVLIELFDFDNELTISFSHVVPAAIFDFALDISGSGNLNWTAYESGTPVDSGTMTAMPLVPGGFAEGNIEVSGVVFDTLVLSSLDATAFAIDNLLVFDNPEHTHFFSFDTPEPLTLAVFGAGLLGAGSLRRRRRPL